MNRIAPIKSEKNNPQESEKKWGKNVMRVGFAILPSLIFKAQQRLGLTSQQLVVLLHLSDYWWEADRAPWPSVTTLANRMGLQRRQVQRIITDLETAHLVKRIERKDKHKGKLSNAYDLSGLVKKLKELAPEFLEIDKKTKNLKKELEIPKSLRTTKKKEPKP